MGCDAHAKLVRGGSGKPAAVVTGKKSLQGENPKGAAGHS
jgi:hypothetical protein